VNRLIQLFNGAAGILFLLSLFLVGAVPSCGSQGLIPDASPAAIAAGDFTALIEIEGCGYQPQVQEGYAYCRMNAGPVGNLAVTFIAPPQARDCPPHACAPGAIGCDPASCVDFTLFFPDGSPAYGDSIPHGQTSRSIAWSKLTGSDQFAADQTGFWPYTYTIRWTDTEGNAQKTVSDGEIRLRVVQSQVCDPGGANCESYVPLRTSPDDPNFVWSWVQNGQVIRMTTGARTYVDYTPSVEPTAPGHPWLRRSP
jgi:hypothetical protein